MAIFIKISSTHIIILFSLMNFFDSKFSYTSSQLLTFEIEPRKIPKRNIKTSTGFVMVLLPVQWAWKYDAIQFPWSRSILLPHLKKFCDEEKFCVWKKFPMTGKCCKLKVYYLPFRDLKSFFMWKHNFVFHCLIRP